MRRVAEGGSALDPEVVMAEGRSNAAIADKLTPETHRRVLTVLACLQD